MNNTILTNINSTVNTSPFALRENERVEISETVFRKAYIDAQNITNEEKLVLGCIADSLVTTSRMVAIETGLDQRTVCKKIKKLYIGGYIKRGQFVGNDGCSSSFCFYFIRGGLGNTLHYSVFGYSAKKYGLINSYTTADDFKRILSLNQYLLMMKHFGNHDMTIDRLTAIENISSFLRRKIVIRPSAVIRFANRKPIFVECVRSKEDYTDFLDKLARYKKLLGGKTSICGETVDRNFSLVLICESPAHAEDIKARFDDILKAFCDITFISDCETNLRQFALNFTAA